MDFIPFFLEDPESVKWMGNMNTQQVWGQILRYLENTRLPGSRSCPVPNNKALKFQPTHLEEARESALKKRLIKMDTVKDLHPIPPTLKWCYGDRGRAGINNLPERDLTFKGS